MEWSEQDDSAIRAWMTAEEAPPAVTPTEAMNLAAVLQANRQLSAQFGVPAQEVAA